MTDTEKLGMLIASRLNHDYVSPLTAISNGLELLELYPNDPNLGIEIIRESLAGALAELQYNRIAFGTYSPDEPLSLGEVKKSIQNLFAKSEFALNFTDNQHIPQKVEAKLWFLAILCLRSSLVSISEIIIDKTEDGWRITSLGKGIKTREGKFRAENDWVEGAKPGAANIHFTLFFQHAKRLNFEPILQRDEEKGAITLTLIHAKY